MGHNIKAFIGKRNAIEELLSPIGYQSNFLYKLPQDFWILLCDNEYFFDLACDYMQKNNIQFSEEVSDWMIQYAELTCKIGSVAYIETDYFGGIGSQSAIFIRKGKAEVFMYDDRKDIELNKDSVYPQELLNFPVNKVLIKLGVKASNDMDEFDSINLSNYRRMP